MAHPLEFHSLPNELKLVFQLSNNSTKWVKLKENNFQKALCKTHSGAGICCPISEFVRKGGVNSITVNY